MRLVSSELLKWFVSSTTFIMETGFKTLVFSQIHCWSRSFSFISNLLCLSKAYLLYRDYY